MAYLIFALRLAIGAVLVVAGILKAHDGPAVTASFIAGYRLLPAIVVAPLGVALPYVEMFLGAYLLLGLFTRLVASIVAAQFVLFGLAVASLVIRHLAADCGCFGAGVRTPPSWWHVAGDLLVALLAGAIAARAPGAFAVDRFLGGSGTYASQHEA